MKEIENGVEKMEKPKLLLKNCLNLGISLTPKKGQGEQTMQEHAIQYNRGLKRDEPIKEYLRNETRCMIFKNALFEVERIVPEHIMLKCGNCGETHMIYVDMYGEDMIHLSFSCLETEEKK